MCAGAGEYEHEFIVIDVVHEEPVAFDMEFAVPGPVTSERVITILGG